MASQGYSEYERREFCKDVKCPNQIELEKQTEGQCLMRRHARNAAMLASILRISFASG